MGGYNMRDIRPNLTGKAEVFRYYKRKVTHKLTLSKYPIVRLNLDDDNYPCREDVANSFGGEIGRVVENSVVNNNEYELVSSASIKSNDKILTTTSSIGILSNGLGFSVDNEGNGDKLCLTMDYILGILGVCLSHGDEEKVRREIGIGCAGDYNITGEDTMTPTFWYNVLSPFWISSPILVSLVYGIARDCYIMNADYSIDVNKLFNKIDKREIYRIINEVDYKAAIKVYRDIILKWYGTDGVRGSLYTGEGEEHWDDDEEEYYVDDDNEEEYEEENDEISILSNGNYIACIKLLIGDDGYQKIFNPNKVKLYWRGSFNGFGYGLSAFCYDVHEKRLDIYEM